MRVHKILNILYVSFAVMIVMYFCKINVFATESDDHLKTVRVGYTIFGGYQEGGEGDPKSGYGYEYLQQIAYFAGWKYEYVYGGFSELLRKLENGEIDVMGNISYTSERAKSMDFSDEEQGREYYYLFAREDKIDITDFDLSSINGMTVGINKDSIQADLFTELCEKNNLDAKIILYDSGAERDADLEKGLLDATVTTNLSATVNNKYHGNPVMRIGYSSYYFAINKNRPDILEDINKAMHQVLQLDWYYNDRVYLKYYGNTSASVTGLTKADQEWAKEHDPVTIGYIDDFLPYSDLDETTGKLTGFLASFQDIITDRYGVDFETKVYDDYQNMENAMKNGEIDTMFPTYGSYWTAEENNLMIANVPINSQMLIIYGEDYNSDINSRIAITDRTPMQRLYVREHHPDAELVVCDCLEDCVRAVVEEKADCTLIVSDVYYINRAKLDRLGAYRIVNIGHSVSAGFGTTRDNIDVYTFMRKCVSSITESELNEALIKSHHVDGKVSVVEFLEDHVLLVMSVFGIILLLVLTLFALYVYSHHKTSKLHDQYTEMSEKAFTDFATELPNKNRCEQMLLSSLPADKGTACYMFDLNDLKVINDTLGHETGDAMIFAFARILRRAVPEQHFVGRFGGDEFIAILKNISGMADAEKIMKKTQTLVAEFNASNKAFQISYACGCAASNEHPSCNMMELLHIADQRMYEDKARKKVLRGARSGFDRKP